MDHIIQPGDSRYDALLAQVLSRVNGDMEVWEKLKLVLHPDDIAYCIEYQLSQGELGYLEFLLRDDLNAIDAETMTFERSFCPEGASWYAGKAHVEVDALRTNFIDGWLRPSS